MYIGLPPSTYINSVWAISPVTEQGQQSIINSVWAISPVTEQGQHSIIQSDGESLVMEKQNERLRDVDYIVIYFSILE